MGLMNAGRTRTKMIGLTVFLVLAAGAVAVAAPFGLLTPNSGGPQGLVAVGPVNATNGFPDWYRDTNGVDVMPCNDPQAKFCCGAVSAPDTTGPVVAGDQIVFWRIRYRINDGLKPDTDYKITQPYGTDTVHTDAGATGFFVTQDVGVTPGDLAEALEGRVGPFLKWAPNPNDPTDVPPTGHVGDGVTVTGTELGPTSCVSRAPASAAPTA
jgi:hypothetical protein